MKILRTLLIILLCFSMALSLFACGEDTPTPDVNDGGGDGGTGNTDTPPPEDPIDPTINLGEMYADAFLKELDAVKTITMDLTLGAESYTGAYTDGLGNTDGSEETRNTVIKNFQIIVSITDTGANVCITPVDYESDDSDYAIYVIEGVVYEYDGKGDVYTEIEGSRDVLTAIGTMIAGSITVEGGKIVVDEDLAKDVADVLANNYRVDLPTNSIVFEKSFADKPTELLSYFSSIDLDKTSTAEIIDYLVGYLGGEFSTVDAINSLKGNGDLTVGAITEAVSIFLQDNFNITLQDAWSYLMSTPEFTNALIEADLITAEDVAALATLDVMAFISEYAELTLNDLAAMLITSDEGAPEITLDDIIDALAYTMSMPAEELGIFTKAMQYRVKNTAIENAKVGMSFSLASTNGYLPSFYAKFKLNSIDVRDDGAQYVAKISYEVIALLNVINFSEQEIHIGLPKD